MNGDVSLGRGIGSEFTFFLSGALGAAVTLEGKKIGKLADFAMVERGKVPEVSQVLVSRPFGDPPLFVPWEKVKSFATKQIVLDMGGEDPEKYAGEPPDEAVLLKDHIIDKKVLDTEDREVEVVYDIRLAFRNGKLYVTDVDLSRYGLLRRVGLKGVADFIYNLAQKIRDETISWTYIQPIPTSISSFKGDVKLKVLKETLAEMQPVDVADILEELDPEQRVMLFNELDTERASDTLEEIDPNVQRDLVYSLKKEKVAKLVTEMTPGQGADLLSSLPWSDTKNILKLLDEEKREKIRSILEKQEEKIANFTTSRFIRLSPLKTVKQARQEYSKLAKGKVVVMYLYIVDGQDRLLGVIDIKELLQADDAALLEDIMTKEVIALKPDNTLKEASAMFSRYSFRAIPLVDEGEKLLGVVPYRDVMNLTHHFLE